MAMKKIQSRHLFLKLIRPMLKCFYKKHAVIGAQHILPGSPAVFVCNHLETYAPIVLALYFPYPFRPWVHASVMFKESCQDFLEMDFTRKTLKLRPPFSKWLAGLLAPICIRVMREVDAIPVFRGKMKIRETLSLSVETLQQGINLVIFPENPTKEFSEFLNDFHTGFVHLARQYQLKTGNFLRFYPVFVNHEKKAIIIGKGIAYTTANQFHAERKEIVAYLRNSINEIAIGTAKEP